MNFKIWKQKGDRKKKKHFIRVLKNYSNGFNSVYEWCDATARDHKNQKTTSTTPPGAPATAEHTEQPNPVSL